MQQYSTIAAISTPLAAGGIGIIRLSGNEAITIASTLFTPVGERNLNNCKGFSAIYGKLSDKEGIIDDVIATKYISPKSYTGEDLVEFSCHGGIYILQRALRACFNAGAVPAEPGEFTKRAFLNGKLDLTRAESVIDLINANNKQAHLAALSAREGRVFKQIDTIKQSLINVSAHLAVWADYPEEDLPELQDDVLLSNLSVIKDDLNKILSDYDKGSLYKDGVTTVIAGKPNVGKSTLMNLLAGSQRSIVTEIAGTTRDVVEDTVSLGNIVLRIADTAGIRDTEDIIEAAGVGLAKKRLETSSLVLAVFDSSSKLGEDDMKLIDMVKDRAVVAIVNKSDLPRAIDLEVISRSIPHIVEISALDAVGIHKLEQAVQEVLKLDTLDLSASIVVNERQRNAVDLAMQAIQQAISALQASFTLDAVNVCVDEAVSKLCELTGENSSMAIVNEVFSKFCVGK
ncbi:MAG: tRNA uridine-5-carboxymethylaminomethyl(34) synthesis GTPase MnmE [Oscillospiraceae bacterium]